jgi:hypothetical protein
MPTAPASRDQRYCRRADWRQENGYPPATLSDAASWAWEFLRRNRAYQRDFDEWHRNFSYSPTPLTPLTLLVNYLCDPPPSARNLTYEQYCREAPLHKIRSINDHLRVRWELNTLINPALPFTGVESPDEKKRAHDLKWLFARNTVDVVKPVESTYLGDPTHVAPVSAVCGNLEVVVRLRLDGNFEAQVASLREKLAKFFENPGRDGGLLLTQYATVISDLPAGKTGIHIDPTFHPDDLILLDDEETDAVQIGVRQWYKKPPPRHLLPYLLRAVDLLAEIEEQDLSSAGPAAYKLVDEFRSRCNCNEDGDEFEPNDIAALLEQAEALVEAEYAWLARALFTSADRRS